MMSARCVQWQYSTLCSTLLHHHNKPQSMCHIILKQSALRPVAVQHLHAPAPQIGNCQRSK